MAQRFHDDGRTIYDFSRTFLVECPICGKCASVLPLQTEQVAQPKSHRASCLHCGFTKDWPQQHNTKQRLQWGKEERRGNVHRQVATKVFTSTVYHENSHMIGTGSDWYFGLPLYLQTACCGKNLWAYNVAHLNFLEAFLSATLREVATNRNQSLASRLPRWMIQAHNREAVLQGIQRLRMKLLEE